MTLVQTFETFGFDVDQVQADVVVVGGGGAASRAAVSAAQAGAKVLVVAKAPVGQGGSTVHGASEIMSMGASGYGSEQDSPSIHYEDTMRPAGGFIDRDLVRVLAEDAPARIADLIALGVPFDRVRTEGPDAGYKLIQSDFGSYARALGVKGKTGKAFVAHSPTRRRSSGRDAPFGRADRLAARSERACRRRGRHGPQLTAAARRVGGCGCAGHWRRARPVLRNRCRRPK